MPSRMPSFHLVRRVLEGSSAVLSNVEIWFRQTLSPACWRLYPRIAVGLLSCFGALESLGADLRAERLPTFEHLPGPKPAPPTPGLEYEPPLDGRTTVTPASPVIFEHSDDAGPDQAFFVTGERLGGEIFAWGRSAGRTEGGSITARFLAGAPDWLTANLDITAYGGPFLIWVRNEAGWSRPIRLNVPQPWWCWPALPNPGGVLRVFGRDLAVRPDRVAAHIWLAQPGLSGQWLEVRRAGKYEVEAVLPADASPGRYLLWMHAGHGGRFGWGEALSVELVAPEPMSRRQLAISASGPSSPPVDLTVALEQIGRDGGGTLALGPGEFTLDGTLKVPAKTILRGAGSGLTRLKFRSSGGDAYRRTPAIPSSRPIPAFEPVPRDRPRAAVWLAGHRATLEDLTVEGNTETSQGVIVAAEDPLTWVEGCRIERCRVANLEGVEQEISALHLFRSKGAIVRGNELHGRVLVDLSGVKNSLVSSNILVPVLRYGSRFKETAEGAIQNRNEVLEGCILEHNVTRAPQGAEAGTAQNRRLLWISTGRGSVRHNWLGYNATSESSARGEAGEVGHMAFGAAAGYENQNVGEVILFEANQRTLYFGAAIGGAPQQLSLPEQVTPTSTIRLGNVTRQQLDADGRGGGRLFQAPDDDDGSSEPPVSEYFVSIVQGPGRGQTRRVSGRNGSSLTLDRPWRVTPTSQSVVLVNTGFFQNHVVGNRIADGMAGIQLWIGCNENIIAANTIRRMRRSGLFLYASASTLASSMPRTWNSGLSTCFFNTVEGNWTEACRDGLLVSAGEDAAFRPDFPRTMGTLARYNTFLSNRGNGVVVSGGSAGTSTAQAPPALLGTLVEHNVARDMLTGYSSSEGSAGAVFRRNQAYFWNNQALHGERAAFSIGRPGTDVWVGENNVEGPSGASHEGIRAIDKPAAK